MTKPVLQFDQVHFGYQKNNHEQHIVAGLDLEILDGEFICILGPSGSGKSTLFRLITGLENPINGKILINGKEAENRFGSVGYMPQQDLLMPWRSVIENAILPLELKGFNNEDAYEQVLKLLEEFGLKGFEQHYPNDLSGGMRQRVSFLRSILSGSNILLLDEPFSALDAITRLSMQEWLLDQWEKRKKTILFITHDVNEALFLSDRIYIFTDTPLKKLEEVKVPLSRPRAHKDLNNLNVIDIKNNLLDLLRVKVKL